MGPRRTMTNESLLGLTIQVASVLLVLVLLGRLPADGYLGRVLQFSLVGFGIAFVSHAHCWNWFEFPTDYIAVTIADTTIAWTLVGLAVAGFVKRTTQRTSSDARAPETAPDLVDTSTLGIPARLGSPRERSRRCRGYGRRTRRILASRCSS